MVRDKIGGADKSMSSQGPSESDACA